MATLSEADRLRVWRGLMRYASSQGMELDGMVKSDLKDAVDATDDWIDANQSSFNTALPSAAQTNLTLAQKTLMFCVVAVMRVDPEFVRRLLGVID